MDEEILAEDATSLELNNIHTMLTEAQKYGLLVEVVHSYGDYLASGDSIAEACAAALYDWDI